MSSSTPSARLPSNTLVLLATLAVQSLVAMALLTIPVIAPAVALALNVSPALVGLYIAVAYMGAMTASLLSGGLVRRFGAIRCSQAGLALCALGLGISITPNPVLAAMGALLIGLGYGPITPASSHLLALSTPAHRMSFVFSVKQTGVPLGGGLAGLIVPSLAEFTSWQSALGFVAVCCLVCAAVIQPLCKTLDADKDTTRKLSIRSSLVSPLKLVFSHRPLTVLALLSFMFSISQLSLLTYMVTFLHEDLSMSLITAGIVLAVAQAAGVAGRMIWGYVADQYLGSVRMLVVLSLVIGACALITPWLGQFDTLLVTLLVLSAFGSSAIGWNGVYLAEVARQAPTGQASLATGGTLSMTFLGVVLGPPLFGLIATTLGSYGLAYATLAVPATLCLFLLWRFGPAFRKG